MGCRMDNTIKRIADILHSGLAVYDTGTGNFVFQHCPSQLIRLLGYDRDYFERHIQQDALILLETEDRVRIEKSLTTALENDREFSAYFPVEAGAGAPKWFRIVGWPEHNQYLLLFSGMSPEVQLLHRIVGEKVENVYVINKENYDLLYTNRFTRAYCQTDGEANEKCYHFLWGRDTPCSHCKQYACDEAQTVSEIHFQESGRFYVARFQKIEWNGVPAHIKYVRDITEEVTVEREKERLEKYCETILKHLPGGVAVVHHELGGKLTPEYLSNGFAEMVGMSMEQAWDLYQGNALSGVHPEDRTYVRENLDRCITENREKMALQYRLRKGDGSYIWVSVMFSVIQSSGGETRVYADYHDITEEKHHQEIERQQYWDRIFQHYLMSGPEVMILGHCNITKNEIIEIRDRTESSLLDRFGKEREAFFTGLGTLVVDPAERDLFYRKYLNGPSLEAFSQGVTEILMPCFVKLSDGAKGKYVQFKVNLLETPDTGDVTGILTVTDITEQMIRDKIFQRLSASDYDLVADVDLINDSFTIVSGGDSRIPGTRGCLSERVACILAEHVVKWEKTHVAQMLDPAHMRERLEKEGTYSFTYSVAESSRETLTKRLSVSSIDLRLGRVCLIRTDVTDILKAERKAKRALEAALSEAEKASRVKSDFLSSMSHDIRTPMNAIVGMTTLAQANLDEPDKVAGYLRKISVASQHLLSLINDVLDMSQLEQSKVPMNCICVHAEELMDQISTIMTAQFKDAGIRFVMKKGTLVHPCFQGDPLRIKQILINLLSNAIKFTMKGGLVEFRLEELICRSSNRARYLFEVSDTGIGMSDDFQKHLFEPFIRSDRVRGIEGSGLGLSITKGLVDQMGGEIRVKSRLGKGTTFQIELEFEAVADKSGSLKPCANEGDWPSSLKGRHFLLVEDNAINSEILGELLQMHGATYLLKENGHEAVEEFRQCKPGTYDAILMDIQMPVMNGYEAARAIRKLSHPDAKAIVILALTANAFAEDVQKAMSAGMNGHVAKPVDMKLLCNVLLKLLPPK